MIVLTSQFQALFFFLKENSPTFPFKLQHTLSHNINNFKMKFKILACKKDLILTEAPIYFLCLHSFSKHQKQHIPFPSNIWAQLIRKPIQLCTLWFTDYGNLKDSSNLKGHRRCFVLFPLMALMGIIYAIETHQQGFIFHFDVPQDISFRCAI